MEIEPKPAPLKGTKYEVMQSMLEEMEEDIWRQCRKLAKEEFQQYFDTKYAMFKQVCPTLYKKAMDGSFVGTVEHAKIIELAEDIKAGKKTKQQADSVFTWWMSDKYRIQERYGKKAPGPKAAPSQKAAAAQSWLFD